MDTSEGLLIEDGELTIHIRKATKVEFTFRIYFFAKTIVNV